MTTPNLAAIEKHIRKIADQSQGVDAEICEACNGEDMQDEMTLCPACLLAAADAIAAAAKLPRTADGKMVVPGMIVWPKEAIPGEAGFKVFIAAYDIEMGEWIEGDPSPDQCYSTREFALAAAASAHAAGQKGGEE